MLKKLRIKFVCITMVIATAMLCVVLGLVIHFTQRGLEAQSVNMLRTIAPMHSPPGRPKPEIRIPYFALSQDSDGGVVLSEGYDGMVEASLLPEIMGLALQQEEQTGVLKDYSLRFWKQLGPGGRRILFADISGEQAAIKSLVQNCVFMGIMGFLLFLGISVLLAKWAIRPVELAWQQQRQFVADASHELKTPLTVITTNAELLQSAAYSEKERQRFSENIYAMSQQMRRLVEGLLELARADNGGVKSGFSRVDMSALVAEMVLPFEPLYFERELLLTSDVEADIRLLGSADHLRQVLDILLDNAMKYTSPGGTVQVFLRRQGQHCVVEVTNPGKFLSREERKNIFRRFYRVDKARSQDGSYGLGLSIAQRIVEEHRGKIWAESDHGVNRFFVQLPLNG